LNYCLQSLSLELTHVPSVPLIPNSLLPFPSSQARNQAAQQKSSGKRILTLDDSDAAAAGARAAPFVPTAMFRAVQAAKATTASGAGSSSSGGSHQREGRITEEMDPQELRLKLFALFAENDKLWIQVRLMGERFLCDSVSTRPFLLRSLISFCL